MYSDRKFSLQKGLETSSVRKCKA